MESGVGERRCRKTEGGDVERERGGRREKQLIHFTYSTVVAEIDKGE